MKILLYSSVFWPSLGGIETITATLAENIVKLGHECIVVTETPSNISDKRSYQVVRKPSLGARFTLASQCDLVHSNGASVAMYPFAKLNRKPFLWTHNGYQVSCVDGLGWFDGEPAPMTPVASLKHHLRKRGISHFTREAIKLTVRRYVSTQVDLNIACTHWVAKRQPLKKQIVAYTPYRLSSFQAAREVKQKKYDFIFVGRLVGEKGVNQLINAFRLLVSDPYYKYKTLVIVGNGSLRKELETKVKELGIDQNVFFLGSKRGKELVEIIGCSKIAIVPSLWEEPMGGVALELLAAGLNMIVSEKGGHAECVGEAGLKFKNGDVESLYKCMVKILEDDSVAKKQIEEALKVRKEFDEEQLTKNYIDLYWSIFRGKKRNLI